MPRDCELECAGLCRRDCEQKRAGLCRVTVNYNVLGYAA
jgi:hypothetical protein